MFLVLSVYEFLSYENLLYSYIEILRSNAPKTDILCQLLACVDIFGLQFAPADLKLIASSRVFNISANIFCNHIKSTLEVVRKGELDIKKSFVSNQLDSLSQEILNLRGKIVSRSGARRGLNKVSRNSGRALNKSPNVHDSANITTRLFFYYQLCYEF